MSLYLHRYGAFHTDSEIPIVNVAANQKMVLMGFITMTGDIEKTSNEKKKIFILSTPICRGVLVVQDICEKHIRTLKTHIYSNGKVLRDHRNARKSSIIL